MEISKIIAQTELRIFGGAPKITRFWDNSNDKNIDILKCVDVPQKGIQSCASIGLWSTDIGLMSNGDNLRVEILGASDILTEDFGNIVASVAFEIMDSHKCFPGYIIKNVISQYVQDCDMKHVLLTDPFLWKQAKNILLGNICVAWLMIVPISESEYQYAQKNGVVALEKMFEEKEIDIYNIYRNSIT